MRAFVMLCGAVLAGLIFAVCDIFANPLVSNIAVSQRENTKLVDISYDVSFAGGDMVDISCDVSTNAGVSYDVPASSFSGDYGAGVSTGIDRIIVWNAGVDWNENYSEQMRVRITAGLPRFQVVDDDGLLIMDNQTGLLWNQSNHSLFLPYDQAVQHADMNYAFFIESIYTDYSGWRLPTYEEFQELADAPTVSGLPYGNPFIISSTAYWTSGIGLILSSEEITYMEGFSFYDRDGTGWSFGGTYIAVSYIPVSQNTSAKLLLVKEPD